MKIKTRKEIRNFQPYIPGKPISEVRRELGLKGKIIKLASNENPLNPPARALKKICAAARNINLYPDGSSFEARRAVGKLYGVSPENVIMGSGVDELIELVGKTFLDPADNIVISRHSFIRYRMTGELMGCAVKEIPMKDYTHDLEAMAGAVNSRTKAVCVVNPNNPTGTYNTKAELLRLFARLRKKGSPLVVLDEAYYDYAKEAKGYVTGLSLFAAYPNLLVFRTLSKNYALAGMRVGFGVAGRQVISDLDRVRPPFNVNSLAQAAACAMLGEQQWMRKCLKTCREGKKYICDELRRMGAPFIPSAANFVLINVSPARGRDVFQRLLRKGIIVRAMDEYELPAFIRVTVGLKEQNRAFIRALGQVLGK